MFKIIGLVIVVAATSAVGVGYASLMKKRLCSLEEICGFLSFLELGISEMNTPIAKLAKSYKSEILSAFLCDAEVLGFAEAFRANKESLALEDEEMSLLVEFSSSLGSFSASEEIKRCRYFRQRLEKIASDFKEKLPLREGMFKYAGIMCGLLIAILLI